MSIYSEMKAQDIPYANHESDLYLPDTLAVRECLARHGVNTASTFVNQAAPHKGEIWLDVPFAFDPWWEARAQRVPVQDVQDGTAGRVL